MPRSEITLQRCAELGLQLPFLAGHRFVVIVDDAGVAHSTHCPFRPTGERRELAWREVVDCLNANEDGTDCRPTRHLQHDLVESLRQLAGPTAWLLEAKNHLAGGRVLAAVTELTRYLLWEGDKAESSSLDDTTKRQLHILARRYIDDLDSQLVLPGTSREERLAVLHALHSHVYTLLEDDAGARRASDWYRAGESIASLLATGRAVTRQTLAELLPKNRFAGKLIPSADQLNFLVDAMSSIDTALLGAPLEAEGADNPAGLVFTFPSSLDLFSHGPHGYALAAYTLTGTYQQRHEDAGAYHKNQVALSTTRAIAQLCSQPLWYGDTLEFFDTKHVFDDHAWNVFFSLHNGGSVTDFATTATLTHAILTT